MLLSLISFESRFQTTQRAFQVLCAGLFLIGFCVTGMGWFQLSSDLGEPIFVNGPFQLALGHAIISMTSVLLAAIFASTAMLRDYDHNYSEITHTTPAPNQVLGLSRFFGAWAATLMALTMATLGMLAGTLSPLLGAAHMGPLDLTAWVMPWVLFFLIGSFLTVAIFCAIAAISRRRSLVWVAAIGLFVFMSSSGTLASIGSTPLLGILVDPIGFEPFNNLTQNWSVSDKNARAVPFLNGFGANRLIWACVGLLGVAATILGSHRGIISEKVRRRKKAKSQVPAPATSLSALKSVPVRYGASAQMRQFTNRLSFELRRTCFNLVFLLLAGFAIAMLTLLIALRAEMTSIPQLPTSAYLAGLIGKGASVLLMLIAIFFGSEIIWRDRNAKFDELLHATPVRNGSLMAAKWVALLVTVFGLTLCLSLYAMLLQGLIGVTPIELGIYAKVIIADFGLVLFFSVILVLTLQSFISNPALGLIAGAVAVGFITQIVPRLPFAHPLLSFGTLTMGPYSDMNGHITALRHNTIWTGLYWLALASVATSCTAWLWPRGLDTSLTARLRTRSGQIKGPLGAAVALGLLATLCVGSGIVWALNIKGNYVTSRIAETRMIQFEQTYHGLFDQPVPTITSVNVVADIYPSKMRGTFSGTISITNLQRDALQHLVISPPTSRIARVTTINVTGATPVAGGAYEGLEAFGYYAFKFDRALGPGQSTTIDFEVEHPKPGFGEVGRILNNGTFITTEQALPSVGLRPQRITNAAKRSANNLPPLMPTRSRSEPAAIAKNFLQTGADLVSFTAKVCTDIDQTPFASGFAESIYTQGKRSCGNYSLSRPDGYFFAFMSGKYELREAEATDIPIKIYSSDQHPYNIDQIEDAVKTALGVYSERFGDYPFPDVKLVEFPYARHAQSHVGLIAMGERMAFLTDISAGDNGQKGELDLASFVTTHELAHQWFGHLLLPADTVGAEVLTESLSEYAASLAIEAQYDWAMAKRLRDRNLGDFLQGRANAGDQETALAVADGDDYLTFNKGHVVFWSLRHALGEAAIDAAIQDLLAEFSGQGAPYPTTLDLIDALKANAPDSSYSLIKDYLETITVWDANIENAVTRRNGKNTVVSFDLELIKTRGVASSAEEIDLNEWIEIGLYDKDPDKYDDATLIRLDRAQITKPMSALSITSREPPGYIKIDPRGLLIEVDANDNGAKLKQ